LGIGAAYLNYFKKGHFISPYYPALTLLSQLCLPLSSIPQSGIEDRGRHSWLKRVNAIQMLLWLCHKLQQPPLKGLMPGLARLRPYPFFKIGWLENNPSPFFFKKRAGAGVASRGRGGVYGAPPLISHKPQQLKPCLICLTYNPSLIWLYAFMALP
jgi:hypothetical protein